MLINNADIIREKRKTLKITINNEGKLIIFCPLNLPIEKIDDILSKKENLINKKIKNIQYNNNEFKDIIQFKKALLLGKEYYIVPTEKVNKFFITDDSLLIPKKYIELSKIKFYLKKSFKEIAKKVIIKRVIELYNLNNIKIKKYNNIIIGDFKRKWGSCDNLGNIKLNWKLIMLKPKIIDFVINHELIHLIELNHSKNFYNLLQKVAPECKKQRNELKKMSFILNIYD